MRRRRFICAKKQQKVKIERRGDDEGLNGNFASRASPKRFTLQCKSVNFVFVASGRFAPLRKRAKAVGRLFVTP